MPTENMPQSGVPSAGVDDTPDATAPADAPRDATSSRELARVRSQARRGGLRVIRSKDAHDPDNAAYDVVRGDVAVARSVSVSELAGVVGSIVSEDAVQSPPSANGRPSPASVQANPDRPDALQVTTHPPASEPDGPTPGTASGLACPRCGVVRVGSFRYCRSCGADFEPDHPAGTMPMVTPEEPATPITLDDRWIAAPLGAEIMSKGPSASTGDRGAPAAVPRSDPAPVPADRKGRLWWVLGMLAIIAIAAIVGAASVLIIYALSR